MKSTPSVMHNRWGVCLSAREIPPHRSNDTGRKKAPLPKGAGTAGEPPAAFAVTEGFHSRHFPKVQTNVARHKPHSSLREGAVTAGD